MTKATAPRGRPIGRLPAFLTRVRTSPGRVSVDTVDVMVAMFTLALGLLVAVGGAFSGPPGSWPYFMGIAVLGGVGPRLHFRVSPGRVTLVRTFLWVPWWFTSCRPPHDERFTRSDFDEYYLVAPTRADQADVEDKTIVLSAGLHGVGEQAVADVAEAARAVVTGARSVARA